MGRRNKKTEPERKYSMKKWMRGFKLKCKALWGDREAIRYDLKELYNRRQRDKGVKKGGKMKKFLGVMVFLVLLAGSAFAENKASVAGGWLHTSNSNYGDSGTGQARIATEILNDVYIGFEGSYHAPYDWAGYGDLSGATALGEVFYYLPLKWVLRPYVFGGWGWGKWSFDVSESLAKDGINVDLGSSFVQKYGVGMEGPIRGNWSWMIEWYWMGSDIPKDSYYEDGSFSNVLGNDDRSGRVRIGEEETNLVFGVVYSW